MRKLKGVGSASPGCISKRDQSMLRPSRRGGVPVFRRVQGSPSARTCSARICEGGSPLRPHVILLDMHLATIDAREVCKQVKNSPDLQLTKVIAMSGKLSEEEAKGLMASGFDGFLKKPFHVRQVIEAVEDAMAVVY